MNKGITSITYNELDLPLSVTTQAKSSIQNTYSAGGTLLQKTITFPAGSNSPLLHALVMGSSMGDIFVNIQDNLKGIRSFTLGIFKMLFSII